LFSLPHWRGAMTFTFTVRAPERMPLTFGGLQRALGVEVRAVERVAANDPVRGLLHLYRPGVSTRAVEVEVQDDGSGVDVSVFSVASTEDHALAVTLVEAIAINRGTATVETEEENVVSLADLRDRYGTEWATRQLAFGVRTVARMVDENPGSLITMQGPIRPFFLGTRLMAELRGGGAAESIVDRLVHAMRRTQWPPDCFAASVMAVSGGPSEKRVRLAVLTGQTRTLLPDVDAVALRDSAGGQLYVPPADVARLLPEHARYLDERHLLVEAVEPARWDELILEAGSRAIDIDQL
jgi:hypothetical protein